MATIAFRTSDTSDRIDRLSGTPRAGTVDRWIYVFMAAFFILITLVGFIPDSLAKIAQVKAGERPPFPMVLHAHAILMGSFLLLLLAQTVLVAKGRCDLHRSLGLAATVLVPALVLVGFILIPTTYHSIWGAAQAAPAEARPQLEGTLRLVENIMLLQIRIGLLFPILLAIGLRVRGRDAGLHKRMMILGTAMALPAAFDRMAWLPSSLPAGPITTDIYPILAIMPMLVWDIVRNRSIHRAYRIWMAVYLPVAVAVHMLWDTDWWHATARQLMGV